MLFNNHAKNEEQVNQHNNFIFLSAKTKQK
jgi:hypothetical protein